MHRGRLTLIIAAGASLGLVAYACTMVDAPVSPAAPALVGTTTTTQATTTTIEPPRVCQPADVTQPPELFGSAAAQSIVLSKTTFTCADRVFVMAPADAPEFAATAASHDAPLLIFDEASRDDIIAEIARLEPDVLTVADAELVLDVEARVEILGTPNTSNPNPSSVWLVETSTVEPALLAYSAALSGASIIANVAIADLSEEQVVQIQGSPVMTFGDLDPTDAWRLSALQNGTTAVNGSTDLLDNTRFVAFYGNPTTPFLGVLGEQGPAATLERMLPILDEYAADGALTVPTFEIIATVADAVAGDDGDYSAEMGVELIQPWVDVADENNGYVVLDLQPGRTDFLTQAMRYEAVLRLPNVGLALDPEWRLEPDEFHLRQIGSVDAAEINLVSEWLATIVREEALPQKLFLVHQFRFDMITGRETIQLRPELATVIQMDGQGPLPTKYETFGALTAPSDAAMFGWGWKNFYDEDSPMATAAQVLDLNPLPVFVSFQ